MRGFDAIPSGKELAELEEISTLSGFRPMVDFLPSLHSAPKARWIAVAYCRNNLAEP